ncbi:MAG TPA: rod shape-determining protein MreD [Allosphingosinicella sp.]|nr:rod shape-determining protein MreD [Allosphingosinicella sp.]
MRIAASGRDTAFRGPGRPWVPLLTTLGASLLQALPVVVTTPVVPDFAFLVLLSWRLLRPEMWQAYVALPLGLFNDLVAGHPLGQSMALWTATFLACDLLDSRSGWRDYWLDWLFAALVVALYTIGEWRVAWWMGSRIPFEVVLPQMILGIFCYPVVARLVVSLDRWRLTR